MITISVLAVGAFLIKLVIFVFISGFLAMFFMWPINDQPTSALQVILWLVAEAILVSFMFFSFLFPKVQLVW